MGLEMRSLERGGLEGKRVILFLLLLLLQNLIVDEDLKGGVVAVNRG